MANSTNSGDACYMHPTPFLRTQYFVVSVFGSAIAILGLVQNVLLFNMFLRRSFFRRSYFFYFWVLGMLDILHAAAYIAVFSVCIAAEFHEHVGLLGVWHGYVVPASTVMEIVRTASVYILVAASGERYLYSTDAAGFCSLRKRLYGILGVLFFSCVLKGSRGLELQVRHRPACEGAAQFIVELTPLALNAAYQNVWMFYARNLLGIFCPFFLVIALNAATVLRNKTLWRACRPRDRKKSSTSSTSLSGVNSRLLNSRASMWVTKAKSRVRKGATRTLIAIVCEYILCSGLGVALTAMEHLDPLWLESRWALYTFLSDAVSLLSVFACALRLPTYCLCDVTFRKELAWFLCCGEGVEPAERPVEGRISRRSLRRRSFVPVVSRWKRLAATENEDIFRASSVPAYPPTALQRVDFGDVVLRLLNESRRQAASEGASVDESPGPSRPPVFDVSPNAQSASAEELQRRTGITITQTFAQIL